MSEDGPGGRVAMHGELACSFCGKRQRDVRKLIAGPAVWICDECIGLCNDIITEEEAAGQAEGQAARDPAARRKGLVGQAIGLAMACRADPGLPPVIADMAMTLALAIEKA